MTTGPVVIGIKPVSMFKSPKGGFIFDLGQNISGWVQIKVKGEPGTKITLRHAEKLNPDSTLYTTNLLPARATDTYILKGGDEETYEPSFTYHGFRYVEMTGYSGTPDSGTVTGCAIRQDAPITGTFECGVPMVNKLWNNTLWSQRDNFISVPTDCPQRAERLGWMGDGLVFCGTAAYNMSVAPFYSKWMWDIEDGQAANGAYADFSPRIKVPDPIPLEAAPGWGDAGIVVPWTVYRMYGDTEIIDQHWVSMEKWMNYIMERNPDFIRLNGGNLEFGDWVNVNAETPKDLFATAFWAYDADIMSKMAAAIGKTAESSKYAALYDSIKQAFRKKYIAADGRITGDTQTCYLMALNMDLMPDSLRTKEGEYLKENIEKRDWHLSTGFFGSMYINPVLSELGYNDIACRLLLNDTWPSWGYQIKNGATTIWERWDKEMYPKVPMSYNHYSFGAVCSWLYRYAAGIDLDPDVCAFRKFVIKPYPSAQLGWVKSSYNSINGLIKSEWALKDSTLSLSVTIPANTSATVFVPGKDISEVTESGKPGGKSRGTKIFKSRKCLCGIRGRFGGI